MITMRRAIGSLVASIGLVITTAGLWLMDELPQWKVVVRRAPPRQNDRIWN
jgi:hypothetical protein